jgi:restriction system protein
VLWVVRGGKDGERQDYNLRHGVSTFGWAQLGDISGLASRASVEDAIRASLPASLIAMPLKGTATVVFGEVTAGYTYDPGMLRDDGRRLMGPHLLQVKWDRAVREAELAEDLVVSLSSPTQTVLRPRAAEAESRIRTILGD